MSYENIRIDEGYPMDESDDESIQVSPLLQTEQFQDAKLDGPTEGSSYVKPAAASYSKEDPWADSYLEPGTSSWRRPRARASTMLPERDFSDPYSPVEGNQNEEEELTFANQHQRASVFVRKSYQPPPESSSHQQKVHFGPSKPEEDTLPFEATKATASQGRQRMSGLPRISTGIVMSKENFENYRKSLIMRDGSLIRNDSKMVQEMDREGRDGDIDDDEAVSSDAREQKRHAAKLRQQQEARMSIYRQSMTRLIGESAPHAAAVSGNRAGKNADNDSDDGSDDDDIMEDIPLSILQAHGFPKKMSPTKKKRTHSPSPKSSIDLQTTMDTPKKAGSVTLSRQQRPASTLGFTDVFGDRKREPVGRGLIGEITREEEAKLKRQSMPWGSYGVVNKRHSMVPSETMSAPLPDTKVGDPVMQDIQAKLQQLIETQTYLMQNMNYQPTSTRQLSPSVAPSLRTVESPSPSAQVQKEPPVPSHTVQNPMPVPVSYDEPSNNRVWNRPTAMRAIVADRDGIDDSDDDDDEWREAMAARSSLRAQWRSELAA